MKNYSYKEIMLSSILFCFFVGPATAENNDVKIPDKYLNSITYNLKDPDSAKFRNVFSNEKGDVFCGEVNAKNSYGAYAGYTKFYAIPQKDGSVASEIISENQSDYEMAMIMYDAFCKDIIE